MASCHTGYQCHTRTQEHLNCSFVWNGASVVMAIAAVSLLPLRNPDVNRGLSETGPIRTNQWNNAFFRKHRSMYLPNELFPISLPFLSALLIKGHLTRDYLLLCSLDSSIIYPKTKARALTSLLWQETFNIHIFFYPFLMFKTGCLEWVHTWKHTWKPKTL